jgi:hypothetical protein
MASAFCLSCCLRGGLQHVCLLQMYSLPALTLCRGQSLCSELRAERASPVLCTAKLFPNPPAYERFNEYRQLFKFRSTIRLSLFWHICYAIRFEQPEVNLLYALQMNVMVTHANTRTGRHAYYLFPRRVAHVRIA